MEVVLHDLPGLTFAYQEVRRNQIDPWRLTTVCELISRTHGGVLPFGVKSSHVGIQNTAYEQFLAGKTDDVERSFGAVKECHHFFEFGTAFDHRSKAIYDENIFGVKHSESVWVVAAPCVVVGLEEESGIGCWALCCQACCEGRSPCKKACGNEE